MRMDTLELMIYTLQSEDGHAASDDGYAAASQAIMGLMP